MGQNLCIQKIRKLHTYLPSLHYHDNVMRGGNGSEGSGNGKMFVNKHLITFSFKPKEKISIEMSSYFQNITKILEKNNLSDIEKQLEIEKSWINKISLFGEPDKLIGKSQHLLINKLKKSEETLELFNAKGVLKKKFPNAYTYLNDFHLLMIAYMIALNSVNRKMGYTATARFIGSRIIQYIYYNNIIKKKKFFH